MEDLITKREAADLLGMSEKTIDRRVKEGKIHAIRISERIVKYSRREILSQIPQLHTDDTVSIINELQELLALYSLELLAMAEHADTTYVESRQEAMEALNRRCIDVSQKIRQHEEDQSGSKNNNV